MVLAAVATVTADRLHGRGLAQHVLLASAVLIGGLLLLSLMAAAVSASWQVQQLMARRIIQGSAAADVIQLAELASRSGAPFSDACRPLRCRHGSGRNSRAGGNWKRPERRRWVRRCWPRWAVPSLR